MLNGHKKAGRSNKSNRTVILQACNEIKKRKQNKANVPEIIVDYSSCDISSALDALLTSERICGILDVKNYRHVDYVFPLSAAFIHPISKRETL